MFITLPEILDMIIMIAAVGFIFMRALRAPRRHSSDVLERYLYPAQRFNWHDFAFAAVVVAPAILLHELGHKIVALSFGLSAVFHAAYIWLAIGVVLSLINFPFIFFVPAFVSIEGAATPLQNSAIAFAGPGVNLLLFLTALIVLKTKKRIKAGEIQFWSLTKNINLFLLIFNLIPIPGFDGFTVFSGLWKAFGL